MQKNKKYLINKIIILAVFLFFVFLFSANNAFAELEVRYPTISGQTLTATTPFPQYAKYLFNFGVFAGFFAVFMSLVIAGATYIISTAKADLMADAKDRISGAMTGLLILIFTYLIITTINPQLSIFSLNKLPDVPPAPEQKQPGVYFHKNEGCADPKARANTSGIMDFGTSLRNRIKSVGTVQEGDGYISILYDSVNYQGKCQYLDPNQTCQAVDSFAASASVLKYDPNPNGDGVYFYRNSYFNEDGGYYKISNWQIKDIYAEKLENLQFTGTGNYGCTVPKNEQDCIQYDKDKQCCTEETCGVEGRQCPTLAGEKITSVKIKGDYVVLFVYASSEDPDPISSLGPWTGCQEFPVSTDVNKTGPQQIKWQDIRTTGGVIPNYVIIIPVKK